MTGAKDLSLIIQSRIPLIKIESHEEDRVMDMIRLLSADIGKPMFSWTVTSGLKCHAKGYEMQTPREETARPETVLKEIKNARTPGIFVLCDYHPYLENSPHIIRLLKEIAIGYEYMGHTVIMLSTDINMPDELKHYSANFELPMPDEDTLERIIREEADQWAKSHQGLKVVTHKSTLNKLISSLKGVTLSDARRLARKAIYDDGAITESDLPEINKAKFELLDMDGVLSFEYETESFSNVGGLRNLKQWLKTRKAAFHRTQGADVLDPPKGIMLLGVQGGGKSLAAKAVAGVWDVPMLRLDFAALYNKFFGETERNLRVSLKTAELMAPCVLWIDEIEKGIAAGEHDSGTSKRVLGSLLTWMAERKRPVFIVATSNDISALPPELVRKGRMDEIFFVDLPDESARAEIFKIHLKKRNQDPEKFDLKKLASAAGDYSGAEIEQVIVAGLYNAIAREKSLTSKYILNEIENTRPLSVVMSEQITRLRNWAAGRTVPAN